MKTLLIVIGCLLLSGCATDNAYSVAKIAYIGGKQILVINSDLIDANTIQELQKIDRVAVTYDGIRTEVKKTIYATEYLNATKVTLDTNSTVGGDK